MFYNIDDRTWNIIKTQLIGYVTNFYSKIGLGDIFVYLQEII